MVHFAMRNRRFLLESALCPALNEEMLATTRRTLLEDTALMALMAQFSGLTDSGETERANIHFQTVFDSLYCKLDRLCDEKQAQPMHCRTLAIRWEATGELFWEIQCKQLCHSRFIFSQGKFGHRARVVSSRGCLQPRSPMQCRNKPCDRVNLVAGSFHSIIHKIAKQKKTHRKNQTQ